MKMLQLGILATIFLSGTASADPAPHAIVLQHGHIYTGDPSAPWAEAIAMKGERIVAVGSDAAIAELTPESAQVIDLGGRTVIPGINDAHVHIAVPLGAYLNAPTFVPGPGPTLTEVLALLSDGAQVVAPGTWLFAFVGNNISDDPAVERFALDAVTPDHPVALFAWSGHGIWLNSNGMSALGIAADEPDPFGGFFVRYPESTTITGESHEYAEFAVRRALLAQLPDAALIAQYQTYAAGAVQFGVTSVQDMAVGLSHARALSIIQQADLPLRVRSMCFPLSPSEDCSFGTTGPRVTAAGIKWITDGTPIERLAFLNGEYADRPGQSGVFNLGGSLPSILNAALNHPASTHQLLFHAVGDGAVDRVLDAMSSTPGAARWKHRRTRIEHGDMLFPSSFARAGRLGVVVVQNPLHFTLTQIWSERLDAASLAELEPMASLLAAGIPLAIGSDAIGVPANPYLDMFFAIVHPTHPAEGLTIAQAVSAYTRGSAYAELEEHKKGTLKPGQLADLAVLSQDIFSVPPGALPATQSVLTIVGGEIVWSTL